MEKNREITVKGIGRLSARPDWIDVSFYIERENKNYETGYALFQNDVNTLYKTLEGIGFDKKDIKASVIRVNTKYTHKQGNDVFAGYAYRTTMNLYFEFDSDLLGKIFPAMADSGINPQIRISFTVKDKEEIKNRLLSAAAKGARNKASILCEAMDVKLGKLIKINYNWDEIDIYSNTAYMRDYAVSIGSAPSYESEIEFSPEDIDITDDAVFVWEIE